MSNVQGRLNSIRVNLLLIGAQKSGTTWLWKVLKAHSDIQAGLRKELHYFDTTEHFHQNPTDYRPYHCKFPLDANNPAPSYWLDSTPSYLFEPETADRIFTYNPDAKLIACLRNPVTRAYSHWAMNVLKGIESRKFKTAITQEIADIQAGNLVHRRQAYVRRGYYSQQIRRYLKLFSPDQMLFINQAELLSEPGRQLNRIGDFLELEGTLKLPSNKAFTHSYPGISQSDYTYLENHYRDDNRSLANLLNWDVEQWSQLPTQPDPDNGTLSNSTQIEAYFDSYRKANRAIESGDQENFIASHITLRDFPGIGIDNRVRQAKLLLRFRQANKIYDGKSNFLNIRPTSREHELALIELLIQLKKTAMARKIGQDALRLNPENTAMYWWLARIAIDDSEKIKLLSDSIDSNPFNLTSYILLCRAYRAYRNFRLCSRTAEVGMEVCQFQDTSQLEKYLC